MRSLSNRVNVFLRGSGEGFTLIEILLVSVIVTLIVGVAVSAVVKGLTSFEKMQTAFQREKDFGNFVNEITYEPTDGAIGIMQRTLADIDVSDSDILTLNAIPAQSSLLVVYSLDDEGRLMKSVDSGTAEPVLDNIDIAAGGIEFTTEPDPDSGATHYWVKVVAHLKERVAPYSIKIALRNEGDLL